MRRFLCWLGFHVKYYEIRQDRNQVRVCCAYCSWHQIAPLHRP